MMNESNLKSQIQWVTISLVKITINNRCSDLSVQSVNHLMSLTDGLLQIENNKLHNQ